MLEDLVQFLELSRGQLGVLRVDECRGTEPASTGPDDRLAVQFLLKCSEPSL
jgi:hypothetical protein